MKVTQQQARDSQQQEIRETARVNGMNTLSGNELVERLSMTEGLVKWAASDTLIGRGKDSVPAILTGLSHQNGKIRATCALLLDHVADDRCVRPLLRAIRHDPLEAVRRCALHSLVCDGCKECPLTADIVNVLIQVAANDRSIAVRRRAVFYLSMQRPDTRIAPFLHALLAQETDGILLRRAQNALQRHQAAVTTFDLEA